jgi:hypothetical protein
MDLVSGTIHGIMYPMITPIIVGTEIQFMYLQFSTFVWQYTTMSRTHQLEAILCLTMGNEQVRKHNSRALQK